MVNETVAVGNQTQTARRVQVLDKANGALLAFGDLSEISTVAIASPKGADTITLDARSFGASALPKLQVAGDGMTALVVDAGGPVTWHLNGDGSGAAAGAGADVSFSGVSSIAGAGADTLSGPAATTSWQITRFGRG